MLMFLAILLFIFLVVVHEYGHFLVAKRNKVKVEEFGIGFPPKLAGKKMGKGIFEGYYTINLLPLGGFVRLFGENDADTRKGSFGSATLWVKTKIILAGVIMNFIVALILFTALAFTGMPKMLENQFDVSTNKTTVKNEVAVGDIVEGSPADTAGFGIGDTIISINGDPVTDKDTLFRLTEENAGNEVGIVYKSEGVQNDVTVTLNESNDEGYFGVTPTVIEINRYGYMAPIVGIGTTIQLTAATYQGLADLVVNLFTANFSTAADTVAGPIGVVVILNVFSSFGLSFLLFFMAVISLTLAIMNSLPIPALDGGRLFVTYLFRVLKKPLTPSLEERIHGTGFVVLLALIALISFVDVNRFF